VSLDALLARGLPLLQGLSPADFAGIEVPFTERRLGPWEILFHQKDRSRDVHFLLSGTLIALFWTADGREVIFTRFGIGDHFGELAALDDGDRSLAVVARSEATILTLPGPVFRQLFDQVPALRWRITHGLVSRIRTLTARNLELTTYSVEQRVASYIFGLAVDRGQLRAGGIITEAPTHAEIAATIGSNREMVSRIMSGLAKRGAIRTARQRIELLDPKVLTAEF
jgi:CRP/FNR family cyclic AMP-dependent transcriptional regulator